MTEPLAVTLSLAVLRGIGWTLAMLIRVGLGAAVIGAAFGLAHGLFD